MLNPHGLKKVTPCVKVLTRREGVGGQLTERDTAITSDFIHTVFTNAANIGQSRSRTPPALHASEIHESSNFWRIATGIIAAMKYPFQPPAHLLIHHFAIVSAQLVEISVVSDMHTHKRIDLLHSTHNGIKLPDKLTVKPLPLMGVELGVNINRGSCETGMSESRDCQ